MSQYLETGTVPILDVGLVDHVRTRRVEIVAAVEQLDGSQVVLADGARIEPEALIAATGFRPGLDELVGHLGVLDEDGRPLVEGPAEAARGLWFGAFRPSLGGLLRKARKDAPVIADAVLGHLRGSSVESAA